MFFGDLLNAISLRTVVILFSTIFAILLVMIMLGIINICDIQQIFNMSDASAKALLNVIERTREATSGILDIGSQLLNKLFGWAGVDIDLSKIKVDVGGGASCPLLQEYKGN